MKIHSDQPAKRRTAKSANYCWSGYWVDGVLTLAILFWLQRNEAIAQRAIAVSQALAVNAEDALGTDDGSLSLLLALESVSATYSLDRSVTQEIVVLFLHQVFSDLFYLRQSRV